jgi:hypothetical protein
MANMELITSVTVGAGGAASVTLPATGTIPQTYTDLKIVMSVRDSGASLERNIKMTFNSVGGTSYSQRLLYGNGSAAQSYSASSAAFMNPFYASAANATASTFANNEIYIPNYTSSNFKSVSIDSVIENNATATSMGLSAGLFSNTGAITSIKFEPDNPGDTYVQGSTFYLYGISNVTSGSKATGGVVSSDGTYWYHTFPFTGTFTPTEAITANVLVIAGGGGTEGEYGGGGGGAGGLVEYASQSLTAQGYAITVGAGGVASTNGSNSQFAALTASVGGGRGGRHNVGNGGNGGSGGGGGSQNNSGSYLGGTGTAGQGNNGGNGNTGGAGAGGGGGGAGAAGSNAASSSSPGAGGAGSSSYSSWGFATGTGQQVGGTVWFAGGGGGGGFSAAGAVGGNGGGGTGGNDYGNSPNNNGIANTGGGAGGTSGGFNANGGSGVVIIRYAI